MYLGMVCVRLRLMSHPDVYDRILSFRELPSTRGIRTSVNSPELKIVSSISWWLILA
jgi:hypothetical protein